MFEKKSEEINKKNGAKFLDFTKEEAYETGVKAFNYGLPSHYDPFNLKKGYEVHSKEWERGWKETKENNK